MNPLGHDVLSFFIYFIHFAKILIRFLYLCSGGQFSLDFSCNVFGFGVRVMLGLLTDLGSVPSCSVFWAGL